MSPKLASIIVAAVAAGLLIAGVAPQSVDSIEITYVYTTDIEELMDGQVERFNDSGLTIDGHSVHVTGVGESSGDALTEIQSGSLQADAWTPAASVWGNLYVHRDNSDSIGTEVASLAYSPQVIAMWSSCARELGWSTTHQPSWADVIELTRSEGGNTVHCQDFGLGGTAPNKSTSGLLAMASWYDMANGDAPLTVHALQEDGQAHKLVNDVEVRIAKYWETSLEVMESICDNDPPYVDAIYLQENTLVTNNDRDCLLRQDPDGMVAVYPGGGTYNADYPLYSVQSQSSTSQTTQAVSLFATWLQGQLTAEVLGAFGFRQPDTPPSGLVDVEHGALPNLPIPARVGPMPSGDVARWLQDAWKSDCGGGECNYE